MITETIALVRLKCFLVGGRCMTWALGSRGRQMLRGSRTGRARQLATGRYGCVQTSDVLRDRLPRDARSTGSNRDSCTHRAKFVRTRPSSSFEQLGRSFNLSFLPSFIVFLRREPRPDVGRRGFRPDRPGGSRMTKLTSRRMRSYTPGSILEYVLLFLFFCVAGVQIGY